MSFRVLLVACVVAASSAAHGTLVTTGRSAVVEEREAEMVRIPGGEFVMGADDDEIRDFVRSCIDELGDDAGATMCRTDARAGRESIIGWFREESATCTEKGHCGRVVHLYDFDIDRREVTTAGYRSCVAAGACDPTPLVSGDVRFIRDEWPIVNVTWSDAREFCAWRGGRLPTEAEWEKAARGLDARRFPWGNFDKGDRANRGTVEPPAVTHGLQLFGTTTDESDGSKVMAPPGSYPWGRSPYGVDDMSGNVSEWVADWHSESGYKGQSTIDPRGSALGIYRVVRGGDFDDVRLFSRTYVRMRARPNDRSISRGFRCAKTL